MHLSIVCECERGGIFVPSAQVFADECAEAGEERAVKSLNLTIGPRVLCRGEQVGHLQATAYALKELSRELLSIV